MDAFFKFLSEHRAVLVTILSLITVLVFAAVWAMVWATRNGSDVSLWFFRIKGRRVVGMSSALKIELGSEDTVNHDHFHQNIQKNNRTCSVRVEFKQTFKNRPQVFVALKKVDLGGSLSRGYDCPINRLLVRTERESKDGFNLIFETWDDSIVYGASASWIAVGE